jgi:hypothetical protein
MSATRAQQRRVQGRISGAAIALAALLAAPAAQSGVLFDFNGVVRSGAHSNGLGATGGNSAIATNMNTALASAGFGSSSVSVSGGLATATYNGEGHVPGITLGTSDGGVAHPTFNDGFVINDNFGIYGSAANQFTFTFTNFSITSISFDWEIFPDATCPKGSYCASHPSSANYPDIELLLDGSAVPFWQMLASTPANGDPQAIGTASLTFLTGVHTLTFRDWPAEVGIDNLQIAGCANTVFEGPRSTTESIAPPRCTPLQTPEPSTLPLAALALGAAAWGIGRRRAPQATRT